MIIVLGAALRSSETSSLSLGKQVVIIIDRQINLTLGSLASFTNLFIGTSLPRSRTVKTSGIEYHADQIFSYIMDITFSSSKYHRVGFVTIFHTVFYVWF